MMSAFTLAAISFGAALAFLVTWISLIRRVQVERGRPAANSLIGVSLIFAFASFTQKPETLDLILAGFAVLVCGVFLFLFSMASQSQQVPAVIEGQPLPEFTALDETGAVFDSASLRGRPTLIKFFRGHW